MTPDVSGQIESASGLDIFGDIHGHLAPLERALEHLGYIRLSDGWKPPDGRLALFLGDLIDRGPDNRKVIDTVRTMTTRGDAICLMGNHELNAIHFATEHPEFQGRYLRPRSNKNLRQHFAFLSEYHRDRDGEAALAEDIGWFRTLPLWVETPHLRAIHACWSPDHISRLADGYDSHETVDDFLHALADPEDPLMNAMEVALKGAEYRLPDGLSFRDKEGTRRDAARLKWWSQADDLADLAMSIPATMKAKLKGRPIPASLPRYNPDAPPVFFGHYWMNLKGKPPRVKGPPNACCLDFSVARDDGALGVYRWDGEAELKDEKLHAFQ
jgi:Calcineurin-like phosphoesterase